MSEFLTKVFLFASFIIGTLYIFSVFLVFTEINNNNFHIKEIFKIKPKEKIQNHNEVKEIHFQKIENEEKEIAIVDSLPLSYILTFLVTFLFGFFGPGELDFLIKTIEHRLLNSNIKVKKRNIIFLTFIFIAIGNLCAYVILSFLKVIICEIFFTDFHTFFEKIKKALNIPIARGKHKIFALFFLFMEIIFIFAYFFEKFDNVFFIGDILKITNFQHYKE